MNEWIKGLVYKNGFWVFLFNWKCKWQKLLRKKKNRCAERLPEKGKMGFSFFFFFFFFFFFVVHLRKKRREIPGRTILQVNTNKTVTVRSDNRNQEQIEEEEEEEREMSYYFKRKKRKVKRGSLPLPLFMSKQNLDRCEVWLMAEKRENEVYNIWGGGLKKNRRAKGFALFINK